MELNIKRINKWLWVVLLSFSVMIPSIKAEALHESRYAWRDNAGNILFQTRDHKRILSSMGYRTIGLTVHRTVLGTKEYSPGHEFITIPFTSEFVQTEVIQEDGFVITNFVTPESEFLTKVAAYYPEWLSELQSGETCYVMIDCVMICVEYDSQGNSLEYGQLIDDGSRTSMIIGNTYWNRIDMMCSKCGGHVPPLMSGFCRDFGDSTPICFGHTDENLKDKNLTFLEY